MVFKDRLVKKYGYKVIYRTLIEDLKKLEVGITIKYPIPRLVQLGVLAYSADNLEAHSLGGFSCCFSSNDICRFCHATYKQLESNIHDYDSDTPHDYWTVDDYDKICDDLEEDEDDEPVIEATVTEANIFVDVEGGDSETDECEDVSSEDEGDQEDSDDESEQVSESYFGLRKRCPLNQLESFHAVLGFPPDCMHDLMEGRIFINILIFNIDSIIIIVRSYRG